MTLCAHKQHQNTLALIFCACYYVYLKCLGELFHFLLTISADILVFCYLSDGTIEKLELTRVYPQQHHFSAPSVYKKKMAGENLLFLDFNYDDAEQGLRLLNRTNINFVHHAMLAY